MGVAHRVRSRHRGVTRERDSAQLPDGTRVARRDDGAEVRSMKPSRVVNVGVSVLFLYAGCSSGDDRVVEREQDVVVRSIPSDGTDSPDESALYAVPNAPSAIYLNRHGGTYTAGNDDSAAGSSSIVRWQNRTSATIPALDWTEAKWQSFLACIKDEYARFNVLVTDERPQSGSYIEAAIGGTGAELGYGSGVGGVAPVDAGRCVPIARAVVFIFGGKPFSAQTACEIAAQEIAHAIVPLDHEYLASDAMTYLSYNGHKVFQDEDAPCGEHQKRACMCKRPSQNSVKLLLSTLGPAGINS
jgi:hypothetical protein